MMHCPHCGAQVEDTAQFCTSCGQPLTQPPQKRSSLHPLAIVLAVLIVALGAVIALILAQRGGGARSYGECMALAARYLEELDYEQAEALYLEAIQIDPSQVDSYSALAELYVDQGRMEDALDILARGIEATGSEELQEMYEELLDSLEATQEEEIIEVTDYLDDPTVLVSMLNMQETESWQFFGEGDSYALGDFYLEYIDSSWSMRNDGSSLVTIYGITMDDSFSDLEAALISHGWVIRSVSETRFNYLLFSGESASYAMEVEVGENGGILSWFLCNWPKGDDLVDIAQTDSTGWRSAYESILEDWTTIEDYYDTSYIAQYFGTGYQFDEYFLYDLDQDSVPELLLFSSTMRLTEVFTYDDHLIWCGENNFAGINTDANELLVAGHWHGAGGSGVYEWSSYRLSGQTLELVTYIDILGDTYTIYRDGNYVDGTQEEYYSLYEQYFTDYTPYTYITKYALSDSSGLDMWQIEY